MRRFSLLLSLILLGLSLTVSATVQHEKTKERTHTQATGSKLPAVKKEARHQGKHQHTAAQLLPRLKQMPGAAQKTAAFEQGDQKLPPLRSASVLVLDALTGDPLYQKNAAAIVPIASISKLMTAMVVLDANLSMDDTVRISIDDIDMIKGSHSRLYVGAEMTREAALLLALMSSDNRAAHALARHYPGGLPAFIAAMNRKAEALGMNDSHFVEPTGLSTNNVSTANDLAKMVSAAARYPKIRELSTTPGAKVLVGRRFLEYKNTNALTRDPRWEIALSKTGYISEAGRCLVMKAQLAERPVVIVLLDSAGKMSRVGDANRIKKWMEQASLNQGPQRT